jgi:predicted short-subunit dehydrogenase-like oxidoreductase (DUF2520 family)
MTMDTGITIIGAGAVGRSLAIALSAGGKRLSGIYSLTGRSAALLAKKCKMKYSGRLSDAAHIASTVIIAVPDEAIADAVKLLAAVPGRLTGMTVLHTSGALTSDELQPLKKKGARTGSMHPLQTFPKHALSTALTGCWFALEGDSAAVARAAALVKNMGARHFTVAKKHKTLYHIAAVFASNYQVTLYSVVEHLAEAVKIPRRDLWRIFRPLIERTMENVLASSPAEALTGPIARGDFQTIMNHIAALESARSLEHLIPLYSALGVETAKLVKQRR